jgi:hypothetical protein
MSIEIFLRRPLSALLLLDPRLLLIASARRIVISKHRQLRHQGDRRGGWRLLHIPSMTQFAQPGHARYSDRGRDQLHDDRTPIRYYLPDRMPTRLHADREDADAAVREGGLCAFVAPGFNREVPPTGIWINRWVGHDRPTVDPRRGRSSPRIPRPDRPTIPPEAAPSVTDLHPPKRNPRENQRSTATFRRPGTVRHPREWSPAVPAEAGPAPARAGPRPARRRGLAQIPVGV